MGDNRYQKKPQKTKQTQTKKKNSMFGIHGKLYDQDNVRSNDRRNVEASGIWHLELFIFSKRLLLLTSYY